MKDVSEIANNFLFSKHEKANTEQLELPNQIKEMLYFPSTETCGYVPSLHAEKAFDCV